MVLQNAQRKRFYRIFNNFIVFARDRLVERGVLPQKMATNRMPSFEDLQRIEKAVWGEGRLDVIDEFVDEAFGLPRADLKACAAWKQGILETFYVCRRGHDVLFSLEDDYVFAVRGITHEIDDDMAVLPDIVDCVLVPFDGVITYLVCLGTHQIGIDKKDVEAIAKDVDRARNEGHFAKTERQFALLAPKAAEAAEASRQKHERERAEYEEHGDDVLEGQHQALISKLREVGEGEPSMDDLHNAIRATVSELVTNTIESACLRGKTVTSLEQVLWRYTVEKLRKVEVSGMAPRLKKAELVSLLRSRFLEEAELAVKDPLRLGARCMSDLADLCEEGGVRHIRLEEVENPENLPVPATAYINYFHDGDDYVVVVPEEIVAIFSGMDFDDVRARMKLFQAAEKYLAFVSDARGLIPLDEAIEGLAERFHGLDKEGTKRVLEAGKSMPVAELDDEKYVVAVDLIYWSDKDKGLVLDKDVARKILEEQVGKPPYWPNEEDAYHSVYDMAKNIDEGRALMGFLETHVPDDADDVTFPFEYMKWIVAYTLAPLDPQKNVDTLTEIVNGVALNAAQAHRVTELIIALINVLPKRVLNGYPPQRYTDEVMGGKNSDKLVFVRSSVKVRR